MNSHRAPHSRKPFRLSCAVLLAGLFAIAGMVAAVAEWGSAQQVSYAAASVQADKPPVQTAADNTVPVCGKHDSPSSDPMGQLAAPPRSAGDQLVPAGLGTIPQFSATQWLSFDIRPRAPALPVAAPHLTTVLII
ncbi:hypothetical protein [Nocardia sp. NBC_01327]|uniref:hypothetical protein n=1 Tax=Nocardia sp. NBC_01327 TaxID=2903593 RepID=UPI002E1646E3|nr:hypothetical protein OG326_40795 [Nocardia sp. NBC_01327]